MKTVQQISTHKAVKENGVINIYQKGLEANGDTDLQELIDMYPDLAEDKLCYINVDEEDLLAIFDRLEENNRINLAQLNETFKNS